MPHQALCIISLPYVISDWSKGPQLAKLGFDLCDLDLWPWPFACTSLLSTVITPEKFHNDTMRGTLSTRRSENDNTPQPLDQWTNSPFLGEQDGNCTSFTLTHYLADLFAMRCGPRASPLYISIIQQYPTRISFIPSQLTFLFLKYDY